jgi:hypothetical protein
MTDALGEALKAWHDFYTLVGGAAASLVGLTFIAASIGAGQISQEHEVGFRLFVTPTVVHFSAILAACLMVMAPFEGVKGLGAVLFVLGGIGVAYCLWVSRAIHKRGYAATIDRVDRMWYALAPVIGYVVAAGAAIAMILGHPASLAVLAFGLGLLLIAAIRNAWDMTLWIMMRPKTRD